ncbi:MAG: metallophosphoesterase family protein [Chloroflexi bacterium]|nr:metallophosphoesterase family protein [Chloroflexota bacterium]
MTARCTRIGVISDTHVFSIEELPEGLVAALRGMDLIVHLGDYMGRSLLDALKELNSFRGVYGNMDPLSIRLVLPEKDVLEIGGKRIGVIHGFGAPWGLAERVTREFPGVDAVLHGHSHTPANELLDGVLRFNPGSATGRFPASGKTYGIVTLGDDIQGEIVALP